MDQGDYEICNSTHARSEITADIWKWKMDQTYAERRAALVNAGKKIRTKIDPELSRKLLSRITTMLFETQSALSRDRFKISKEVANATKDTDKETNQRRGG